MIGVQLPFNDYCGGVCLSQESCGLFDPWTFGIWGRNLKSERAQSLPSRTRITCSLMRPWIDRRNVMITHTLTVHSTKTGNQAPRPHNARFIASQTAFDGQMDGSTAMRE